MRLSKYIKAYREEHNLSGRKFAEMVGCSNAYISLIESGKQKNVSIDFLKNVASTTGVSLDMLLETVDDMTAKLQNENKSHPIPGLSFIKKLPLLGSTACGKPIEAVREYEYVEVELASKADFALRAEGKSMTGCGIMDGSLVLLQETNEVENGQIAAISVGNATTIKKFYQYGDTVILRPCNPDYEEQEYRGEDLEMIHVFGKVIACLNRY